jgi:hypothetical protein
MEPPYKIGDYSSFSFRPADYDLTTSGTELTFKVKANINNTPVTVHHPPPAAQPAQSDTYCLSPGDEVTLSVPSIAHGDVTLIGHHKLNIVPARPCP